MLKVFEDYPERFSCIPLPPSDVEHGQAVKDVVREKVLLNGVEFFGNDDMLLEALRRVVEVLTLSPEYRGDRAASEIVERILCKASRTTSGSDSFFMAQDLFGVDSEHLLKSRGEPVPPLDIQVLCHDRSIYSMVSCVNYYGLYSLEDIALASQSFKVRSPPPWLTLDTKVVEKTDHSTGRNVRYLCMVAAGEKPLEAAACASPEKSPSDSESSMVGLERLAGVVTVDESGSSKSTRSAESPEPH